MNSWPLIGAAFAMGASGSLHCIAMCSTLQRAATGTALRTGACASRSGDARRNGWFHGGRILGYSMLGVVAGLSGQWLLGAAAWQPIFHSVWAALNALLLMLGLSMIALGRQPAWLDSFGDKVWRAIRPATQPILFARKSAADPAPAPAGVGAAGLTGPTPIALLLRGAVWALLPCGLLYSALALAILASDPAHAGVVMAAFAVGTTIGLGAFQSLLLRLPAFAARARASTAGAGAGAASTGARVAEGAEHIAFRLNGALLATMASIALVAAIGGHANPFCAT